jgi:hypothetical protein
MDVTSPQISAVRLSEKKYLTNPLTTNKQADYLVSE